MKKYSADPSYICSLLSITKLGVCETLQAAEFYGFTKFPDTSKITRFKQNFLPDLQSFF